MEKPTNTYGLSQGVRLSMLKLALSKDILIVTLLVVSLLNSYQISQI